MLVEVKAAGINPGEISIREGYLHDRWPATFPSGEGTDFAGIVRTAGDGVHAFSAGDEVLGWTEQRASHAELVIAPADQVTAKPAGVPWEVAGSLFVVGMAGLHSVQAVAPTAGETVVVSAAGGGVGSVAAQLARGTGATVIGLASEHNHAWLREHDIVPVEYGDGQAERIREASGGQVDAFIDTFGGGYVELGDRARRHSRNGSTRSSTTRPPAASALRLAARMRARPPMSSPNSPPSLPPASWRSRSPRPIR